MRAVHNQQFRSAFSYEVSGENRADFSPECTFTRSVMRINSTAYIRHLEGQVSELKNLLEEHSAQSSEHRKYHLSGSESVIYMGSAQREPSVPGDEVLETIMAVDDRKATRLQNLVTHQGRFAGVRILQQIRALCSRIGRDQLESEDVAEGNFMQAFDSAPLPQPFEEGYANYALLPAKGTLLNRVSMVTDRALDLMYFIDCVSLESDIDRLYDLDEDAHTSEDRKNLALVYALLAIASQVGSGDLETAPESGHKRAIKGSVALRDGQQAGNNLCHIGFAISKLADRLWTSPIVTIRPLCKLYFAWSCTSKHLQPFLRPIRTFVQLPRQHFAWVSTRPPSTAIYRSMCTMRDGRFSPCLASWTPTWQLCWDYLQR